MKILFVNILKTSCIIQYAPGIKMCKGVVVVLIVW